METLDVTWGRVVQLWWAFLWRFAVVGLLPGLLGGGFVSLLFVMVIAPSVGKVAGLLVLAGFSAVGSLVTCRWIFEADLGGFCVRFVPAAGVERPPEGGSAP